MLLNNLDPEAAVHPEELVVYGGSGRGARAHGIALRLHGGQLNAFGAVGLAVELGAHSIDQLEATGPDGVASLAACTVNAAHVLGRGDRIGRLAPG